MRLESNLKVIMWKKKISQTKLSELSGINRSTISMIANEKNDSFEIKTALKIAKALEVSVEEIWSIIEEE